MKIFDPSFVTSLRAARDEGIRPAYFFWITGRDRASGAAVSMGFWSGDEDIPVTVQVPSGGVASRTYLGGCNLTVEGIQYVMDLTDNPISVSLSQIAPAAQALVRGLDVRLAYCEVHATTFNGGALTGPPQLQWVGIVDDAPISTPAVGGEGGISLTVRSEIMSQLLAVNPAKSSDAHQRRRAAGDAFCKLSAINQSRRVQWYKE